MTTHVRHVEEVMGTVFTVDAIFSDRSERDGLAEIVASCRLLHDIDEIFSTWRPDTAISRLRAGELTLENVPVVVSDVLTQCARARDLSGGWFDPWASPGGVDPTGYVKGWAGQQLLDSVVALGADAGLVNAAGDVAGFGEPEPGQPWRLGLTDPFATDQLLGIIPVVDCALAVSGTYERGEHVFDPRGGTAHSGVISAAVVGPDLGLADALATALVAGGEAAFEQVTQRTEHQALVIFTDGRQIHTSAFPAETLAPHR